MAAGGRRRGFLRRDRAQGAGLSACLRVLLERGHFFGFLEGAEEAGALLGVPQGMESLYALSLAPRAEEESAGCGLRVEGYDSLACMRRGNGWMVKPLAGCAPKVGAVDGPAAAAAARGFLVEEQLPVARISGPRQLEAGVLRVDWAALRAAWLEWGDEVKAGVLEKFGVERLCWGATWFEGGQRGSTFSLRKEKVAKRNGKCVPKRELGNEKEKKRGRGAGAGWDGPGDWMAAGGTVWFDGVLADRVVYFVERFCSHSKGRFAGAAFRLSRWQFEDVLWVVFGWRQWDGRRVITQVYVEIPKKNGKSTLVAALSSYFLLADGEGSPEVYNAAVDSNQAKIVFNESKRMRLKSPSLFRCTRLVKSLKTIECDWNQGIQRVLSAEAEAHEGLNISFATIDELHAHRDRSLYDTLRYGGAGRDQSLLFNITTAGEYEPESIGWQLHEHGLNIMKGMVEERNTWPVIYGAGDDEDWTAAEVWQRVNPGMGETLRLSEMAAECAAAQNQPGLVNAFKRYRLNMWTSVESHWMAPELWLRCKRRFSASDLWGRPCYGGLDLSQSNDLTAFSLVFPPEDDTDRYYWNLSWHWIPFDLVKSLSREHLVNYERWIDEGWVETTAGKVVDLQVVRARLVEIARWYQVLGVFYDPYMAGNLATKLQEEEGWDMQPHRFGSVSMNAPMLNLERLCVNGQFCHDGNPALRWQFANVIAKRDSGGLIKPDKRQARRKIDGAVTVMMATGAAAAQTAEGQGPLLIRLGD